MPLFKFHANPVLRKRLLRFRSKRRAWWSLWLLAGLYAVSLCSELLSNDRPLYVRYEGRSYFPVFRYYSADTFLHNKQLTRPDYKAIARTLAFAKESGNFMIFPPLPWGPYENMNPADLPDSHHVQIVIAPSPRVGNINVTPEGIVSRSLNAGYFFGVSNEAVDGLALEGHYTLPPELHQDIQARLANQPAPRAERTARSTSDPPRTVRLILPAHEPRARPPATVRITLAEETAAARVIRITADDTGALLRAPRYFLDKLTDADRAALSDIARRAHAETLIETEWTLGGAPHTLTARPNSIQWPHPPTRGHPLGLDNSGRDVLSRILYGLRTSLTFGLLLVVSAMMIGALLGAIQGYAGGLTDIVMQRLTEIWSALPFLYIMILVGSIYGRSFMILLFCYALFNWIGISYYMRGEFLRLRSRTFVDAARCQGIPAFRIMLGHILPNALTPLITFFPFSLVGAIGALAALDYLGFGLPPPTPSWGELFQQAQTYRWAWWLILYPGLALFTVMLLGVFIGEGVRDAFDPKPDSRIQ